VSTVKGALYDASGLDINKLIELKKRYTDNLVQHYSTECIEPKELLLEMDTDVLIPCARTWCINGMNMENIKAKMIVPGANVPLTKEAEEFLHQKGILCLPDFICNLGGVFGTKLYDNRNPIPTVHRFIMNEFGQLVKELIWTSIKEHCLPSDIARLVAEKNSSANVKRMQYNSLIKKFPIGWFHRVIHFQRVFLGRQPWIALQRQRRIFIENIRCIKNQR
jgi:glutamate dehydrogenase (NAD(P)+)